MTRSLERLARIRDEREAAGLRRNLSPRQAGPTTVLDLASNDYLGLAHDPRVADAAADAAHRWGTGATGSRLVTGTTALHEEFESALAAFVGCEAALVLSSGYLANLAALTALAPAGTSIVSDATNHASIVDACRLSRAHAVVVPHRDVPAFEHAVATAHGPCVIVTDAVFSVDGDRAPLAELTALAQRTDNLFIVDEAHTLGVVGPGGRGAMAELGVTDRPDVVLTATLSKSLGSQGGAVLGNRAVIDHLIDQARPFIFDTALAPPCVAAALEALRILSSEPGLCEQARDNALCIAALASAVGLDAAEPDAAVVSVRIGSPTQALDAQRICHEHGVAVGCFRPPSVPDADSRLRLTARADLDEPALATVGAALAAVAAHLEG